LGLPREPRYGAVFSCNPSRRGPEYHVRITFALASDVRLERHSRFAILAREDVRVDVRRDAEARMTEPLRRNVHRDTGLPQ
jgi:hypothetical protein